MATEELVTEQFNCLGIDLQSEVLKKCVELCEEYDIDAEEFVEQWVAFSLSHLDGASPTLQDLKTFERKEFSKRVSNHANVPANINRSAASLTVYGAPEAKESAEDLITNYITGSPKRIKTETENGNHNGIRPATYAPSVPHSGKYASRANAGSVVNSFGDESLLQLLAKPNVSSDTMTLNISQVPNEEGKLYTKAMFGFELLQENAVIFDNHINYLTQCIMKKAKLTELSSVRHISQSEVLVSGRIQCDADARLNAQSVVLQGDWEHSLSLTMPLDLQQISQYSLYSGQVVVVRGTNPRGDRFAAQQVFCDGADAPPAPVDSLTGPLNIMVASGPFTTSDNLLYEPLKDFIQNVGHQKPHVVILIGPFVDCEHAHIKDDILAETYKSFFDKLLDSIAEINSLSPHTKTYLVSSFRDAFQMNIFPTPPHSSQKKLHNLFFLPDPCTLDINGVYLTVTSTDLLMEISQEEISHGVGGDKLCRMAGHVLQQRNLWGAWPPRSLPLSPPLSAAHAYLDRVPHILVLPSTFRYFVREVNGTLIVNPEHLTKGAGGGTFARIVIAPTGGQHVANPIAAQIVRI